MDVFKAFKDLIPEEKVETNLDWLFKLQLAHIQNLQDKPASCQVLVPGVIDSTTNFIEHPALVARSQRKI